VLARALSWILVTKKGKKMNGEGDEEKKREKKREKKKE